ncbi:hypothetical protein RRG08_047295 [Elysia crispata]|uniref:Uncharacterized protein n=1 Tax=Elysia crispata TaxID=231223 RepID=A0AAE1DDS1_9GAST|nr:hypothetical protein RRG08_047295 [Elysia crispata]
MSSSKNQLPGVGEVSPNLQEFTRRKRTVYNGSSEGKRLSSAQISYILQHLGRDVENFKAITVGISTCRKSHNKPKIYLLNLEVVSDFHKISTLERFRSRVDYTSPDNMVSTAPHRTAR